MSLALPLFHLYGDPPDDQAFDFIHIETISSRSSVHDWTIRAHRHRNLFQILLIERGGGDMTVEAAAAHFTAPAAIDHQDLEQVAMTVRPDGPVMHCRARRDGLDVDEVERLIVRRITVKMEKR